MKSPDRSVQPVFRDIDHIDIHPPVKEVLGNGIPLFVLNEGLYDIIRIDLVFSAGTSRWAGPLVPQVTNSMLTEGSARYSSGEIAARLDFYGALIHQRVEADTAGITVYTLGKFIDPVLEILEDLIKNPAFPPAELELHLKKRKQQFVVEQEQVKTLARKTFTEALFGKDHPYGKQVRKSDFDTFPAEEMVAFAQKYYRAGNCFILLSGKLDGKIIRSVSDHFGDPGWTGGEPESQSFLAGQIMAPSRHYVEKPGAIQSAVRIGRIVGNRRHADYPGLVLLNTVFGGYFGSRLMKNIREEKGYTYGIGSFLLSMHNAGVFAVVSEVGSEVAGPAVEEIYREMKELGTSLIQPDELRLVKNYLMGELTREFDGPFSGIESFRNIIEYGLDLDYFHDLIARVKATTAEELLDLAGRYLVPGQMTEVVAGPPRHEQKG